MTSNSNDDTVFRITQMLSTAKSLLESATLELSSLRLDKKPKAISMSTRENGEGSKEWRLERGKRGKPPKWVFDQNPGIGNKYELMQKYGEGYIFTRTTT